MLGLHARNGRTSARFQHNRQQDSDFHADIEGLGQMDLGVKTDTPDILS